MIILLLLQTVKLRYFRFSFPGLGVDLQRNKNGLSFGPLRRLLSTAKYVIFNSWYELQQYIIIIRDVPTYLMHKSFIIIRPLVCTFLPYASRNDSSLFLLCTVRLAAAV